MWQLESDSHSWVWADFVCEQVGLLQSNDVARGEPSIELTRWCYHVATIVADLIFMHNGLKGSKV